jgi:hypothetical protein
LGSYLKGLNESTDPQGPIVILARSLQRPLGPDGKVQKEALFDVQESFLDAYLGEERRVFWGSILYSLDDGAVIRRHRLAELYCDATGQIKVIPSIPLVAAQAREISLSGGSTDKIAAAVKSVKAQLADHFAGARCNKSADFSSLAAMIAAHPELLPDKGASLQLSENTDGPTIVLADLPYADRILYRIAPQHGQEMSYLLDRSAKEVLNSPLGLADASGDLVLIGASHADSGDLHPTALGGEPMPGVYILANAIDTLQQHGLLGPPSLVAAIVVLALLNLVSIILFAFFKTLFELVWVVLSQILLLVLGASLLDYGFGLAAGGLPMLLIQVLHMFRQNEGVTGKFAETRGGKWITGQYGRICRLGRTP